MELLRLEDFDVELCVANFYQKDNGRWWWHCLTCNTSTQKNKHGKGHKSEAQAREGMTSHINAMRFQRQAKAWKTWWWKQLMTTDSLEYFEKLWNQYEFRCEVTKEGMHAVQNDPRLNEYLSTR